MAGPTASDVIGGTWQRERTTPGGVPLLRERTTKWEGRSYRVSLTIPGMTAAPVSAAGAGARMAQVTAETLTAHFQAGEDATGRPIAIGSETTKRRDQRRRQWASRAADIGSYMSVVQAAKGAARASRRRAQLTASAAPNRALVLRFLLGAGWYDPHRPVGTAALQGSGEQREVEGQIRVRNQRGARLFPPLAREQQRGGVESGLFANSLTVRFMGGRSGQARVGIFFPAQREEFVQWAERAGYTMADVPAEADAQIDAMLTRQADDLAGGAGWRQAGRTALDVLRGAATLVEWAFL